MDSGILVDLCDDADRVTVERYTMRQMNAWCQHNLPRMVFDSAAVVEGAVPWSRFDAYGAGVYFLVRGRSVTYVGQSNNVAARVPRHEWSGREFDSVSAIIGVPTWIRNCVEYAYIKAWKPPENGKLIPVNGCPGSDGFGDLIANTDTSRVARYEPQVIPAAGY